MPDYPIHAIDSAPENSKPGLEQLQQAFGVIPNIAAAIANSPKLINSLVGVFQQVHNSSLTEQEIQIVLLTDAVTNSSTYAVAFHTALALQQGVNSEETDAIRQRRVPANKRFAALSNLANMLIEKRGHLGDQELDSFLVAGFTKEQVLEVVAIVAASTITNYAGTLANPPLEDPFRQYAWRGHPRDSSDHDGYRTTPIHHVGLHAKDPSASAEFYRNLLSMEIVGGSGPEHLLGASAFLSDRPDEESHEIALFANPALAHVAFRVPSLAAFRSMHIRVVERGIPIKYAFNHGVSFAFYFDDPDGHMIEVYWPTGAPPPSYRQPYAEPLDLTQPDDLLLGKVAHGVAAIGRNEQSITVRR
jgi:alkylhydroperoxidase family enzyme/catechol 2,3-dioxygenase-like lactoylglutathione lyase family enzyme